MKAHIVSAACSIYYRVRVHIRKNVHFDALNIVTYQLVEGCRLGQLLHQANCHLFIDQFGKLLICCHTIGSDGVADLLRDLSELFRWLA